MDKSIILQSIDKVTLSEIITESVRVELQNLTQSLNPKNQDELLTRAEVCEMLKIDASTLWHWTNQGKIKAYGIANRRYYKKSEILDSLVVKKSKK
ncbi:helix-turn-helix domain-containing protein [Chryseobacterium sp. OV279]|uniref:helix-turn-helix domain-containing protein n=1 Tax=Chryseobacterium sp. OV279 TaxID=1500285 RepID=UPI00091845EA|nr:helix-turn-helix domain-containing protein [Chryseobacterium sp. OV279]SHE49375.1 Helix-turn-helix domain-containing protein [Chryseobacterium sp. OV279]